MASGPAPARPSGYLGAGVLAAAAALTLLLALAVGGGAASLLIDDPGPVVRFGLPAARLLVDLSVALALGALVLVAFALPPGPVLGRTLDLAAAAAGVWTVAAAVTGLLTFLSVTAVPLSFDEQFSAQLGFFLTSIPAGRSWLVTTLIAASVTVLCFAVRSRGPLLLVLLLALGGLLPLAEQGHSAAAGDHDLAVGALALHLVFAAVWLGGLLCLILLRPRLERASVAAIAGRYSSIALVCFIAVAASGYVSAEIRVGSLDRLATPYGALVLVKVSALVALGVAGALHRRFALRRLSAGEDRSFWRLVLGELVFLGIASGAAAGLARTASPVSDDVPLADSSPSAILTGEPLPAPIGFGTLLAGGRLDLAWLLLCAFGVAFYLAGVLRLRGRGESWPAQRTAAWIPGMVLLAAVTNGGIALYARHLFSATALGMTILLVAIPLFLVCARPLELLSRAAAPRPDGSRGMREWVGLALDSPTGRRLRTPGWAALTVGIVLALWVYGPALRWSVSEQLGRELTPAIELTAGCLLVSAALSRRFAAWARAAAVGAVALAFAGVGILLTAGDSLLLADWFGAMGWGTSAIADQRRGGLVLLLAALLLAVLAAAAGLRRATPRQPRANAGTRRSPRERVRVAGKA